MSTIEYVKVVNQQGRRICLLEDEIKLMETDRAVLKAVLQEERDANERLTKCLELDRKARDTAYAEVERLTEIINEN
jgi:hypothetical protein